MDILRHYANRDDLLNDLEHTARNLRKSQQDEAEISVSVRSVHTPTRVWRAYDRLSEEDITALIKRYHAGETGKELAMAFGIGLTTLKKILRERKALQINSH